MITFVSKKTFKIGIQYRQNQRTFCCELIDGFSLSVVLVPGGHGCSNRLVDQSSHRLVRNWQWKIQDKLFSQTIFWYSEIQINIIWNTYIISFTLTFCARILNPTLKWMHLMISIDYQMKINTLCDAQLKICDYATKECYWLKCTLIYLWNFSCL